MRTTCAHFPANLGAVQIEDCIEGAEDPKRSPRFRPRPGGSTTDADRRLAEMAGRQHGVVARWQLAPLGFSVDMIKSRLRRGSLQPLQRGAYAVGHRALTPSARWMAAALAGGPEAVLSHRSAGQLWGIFPKSSIAPEVTRPTAGRARSGTVLHRSALPADEKTICEGIPVTTVPRTLVDLAGILTQRQLERAWNEIEVRQLWDPLSVTTLLERHPGRRGAAMLRRLINGDRPADITRNDLEEGFLTLVIDRFGLPRPRMNAHLVLRGKFYEVDCLWERQRLVAELDGAAVHRTRAAFESDRERDRILLAEGFWVTRVTWDQMRETPAEVAADLDRILAAAAARAP